MEIKLSKIELFLLCHIQYYNEKILEERKHYSK